MKMYYIILLLLFRLPKSKVVFVVIQCCLNRHDRVQPVKTPIVTQVRALIRSNILKSYANTK